MGIRENVLETPCCLHGCQTHANNANARYNPAHPSMRADPGHDEIRRQVEDDIADVEQRQTGRHLLRGDVEHRGKIMALF